MLDRPDEVFVEVQAALAGRYSLERELGRGGMGIVYLAREVRLDRPVAIKLLPPARARDARLRERFLREARTAAKLSHPHIVPIFAVDEIGAFVFFAMAYVEGETLTERVRRRGPLPPSEAARVLREIAWALAYAHSQGVVHRDIKPDNIVLEAATGRALVADFGIAAEVRGAAGLDGGEIIGTPEFMSPEQALGERVDGRSDLYALGAVGYFALSGKLPFAGAKATELLAKQITEPAPPVASVAAVPRRLAQAIDRCLAKDPAERPQTGEALAEELGLALAQRRELPVGLRVFVKRNARLGGAGGLIYVCAIPVLLGLVGEWAGRTAAIGAFAASLTVGPLGILLYRARRFLGSGFGPEELGTAFRAEIEQGREERMFEHGRGPSVAERVLRLVCVGAFAIAGIAELILVNATYPALTYARWLALVQLLRWCSIGGAVSGFLAVVQLQRRVDLDTRIWGWVWLGPLGRFLFRIARASIPASSLPPPATHRPTELALGMAAEQLFEELPRQTRSQLRDLPDVVHRLEGDAQRLRRRLDDLQDALADRGTGIGEASGPPPPDAGAAAADRIVAALERERDLVQRRFGEAVKALETIRLNLLRLHAGSGRVQSLTTDLGRARDVAGEIGRQLAAQQEIDEALR
jgi:serine/threonine-protein kinase